MAGYMALLYTANIQQGSVRSNMKFLLLHFTSLNFFTVFNK